MATPTSPDIGRKLLPLKPSTPVNFTHGVGFKENNGPKPLPTIPMSYTAQLHKAPQSPVKLNIQEDNWAQASSAVVEGSSGIERELSSGSEYFETAAYDNGDMRLPATQNLPYRPSYKTSTPIQSPQMAVLASGEGSSSRSPSRGAFANEFGGRSQDQRIVDENGESEEPAAVPQLQYHHQAHLSEGSSNARNRAPSGQSPYDQVATGQSINRHLTPTTAARRTPQFGQQRPMSAYSDLGPRGMSPATNSPSWGGRTPSAQSARSNDRPMSYIDLANVSYPQAPPVPISMDNSQLRSVVGTNASLLSTQKTLEMYRQNIKKIDDSETQYSFAIFLIQTAQESGLGQEGHTKSRKVTPRPGKQDLDSPYVETTQSSPQELLAEAKSILQKLSDRSYPFAQYYLADGYFSGLFNKGEEDYKTALPLFVSASKHGHAESGFRAAVCYEHGWGCGKDVQKAVQYYRQSASKNHPGAATRLGRMYYFGELGTRKYREGVKWLKRGTESADIHHHQAPYILAQLYKNGDDHDVFEDKAYAAQLLTRAADLGNADAAFELGNAYEHGQLLCPRDPALSIHFFSIAGAAGHSEAMMNLCAWYMVGAEPVLEKNEEEGYLWAKKSAEAGFVKAQYAVGYFTESGIGCRQDTLEANRWYVQAADAGDTRAKYRLAAIRAATEGGGRPMEVGPPKSGANGKRSPTNGSSWKPKTWFK